MLLRFEINCNILISKFKHWVISFMYLYNLAWMYISLSHDLYYGQMSIVLNVLQWKENGLADMKKTIFYLSRVM
jgi:hypothetical protein